MSRTLLQLTRPELVALRHTLERAEREVTHQLAILGVDAAQVAAAPALEASVRYLAADLGPQGVRVNAISAGPMRTLAGAVIGGARYVYRVSREASPLRRNVELSDVGGAALYYLSDLSAGVTGTVHFVDSGYHAIGLPHDGSAVPSSKGDE